MKTIVTLSISSIFFFGCEGVKQMSGIIVSGSGKPMQDVEINVLNNVGHSTKTDSLGRFTLNTGFTGMMFGGPKFKFEVKKNGYETQIIKTKFSVDTIKLITN